MKCGQTESALSESIRLNCEVITHSASLVAHTVKNLPAIQETQETCVRSLSQEDSFPLEKEMVTHASILA